MSVDPRELGGEDVHQELHEDLADMTAGELEAMASVGPGEPRADERGRKRVEEIIGWCKTVGGLRRMRFVGRWEIALRALTTGAAYNLLRLARPKPLAA